MKQVIDSIRREHGLDLDTTDAQALRAVTSLTSNLSNSLRNLSEELYTKDLHFVLEFIQNADDNSYATGATPTLNIELDDHTRVIRICCNETGFTERNVRAICSVGKSTKKDFAGYIGEKGIGFKAVFTVASVVYVLSGGYSFKFDNSGAEELGMIAPIWDTQHPPLPGWTVFLLDIPPRVNLRNLAQKLEEIEPTLLLFLRKLRHLNVVVNEQTRSLSRLDLDNGTTVLRSDQDEERYIMVKSDVRHLPPEPKRQNVTKSEIVLAFPVSSTNLPVIADQDVHTFLPLRSFGFSFIIQADFLTTSNREDILANRPWNSALRDAIPRVFLEAVESFSSREELRYNWLQYVPRHASDVFMKPIVAGIKECIRLRGADGGSYRPTTLFIVPSEYQTESSEPLVAQRYLQNMRYLAAGYDTSRDIAILQHLGVKTMTASAFISGLSTMASGMRSKDRAWLERTCSALRSLFNQWRGPYKYQIQSLPLVPLEDGSWIDARAQDIFFIDTSVSVVPDGLSMRFVRHSPPLSDEHRRLLADMGVKTATATEISNQILAHHRFKVPDKSVVLSHAKFIFQYSSPISCSLDVRCRDDIVRSGEKVYMDSPLMSTRFPLSKMLEPYGAHFLHHHYYTVFPKNSDEAQRWFKWLAETIMINVAPRFLVNDLCEEFWSFANDPDSPVLEALRDYWTILSPKIAGASDVLRRLSTIRVKCLDDKWHCLNETYIGRSTLLRLFPDLPFVDVDGAEDHRWNFLASLGVTFDVSGSFYLKRLKEYSKKPPLSVNLEEISRLYTQISARFDEEGSEDHVRREFRDHALIYIPGHNENNVSSPGYWRTSNDVFWDGPRSVFSKPILASFSLYDSLRSFFSMQLGISSCPPEFLVEELRIMATEIGGRNLTSHEHHSVFGLLKDIGNHLPSERTRSNVHHPPWLEKLGTLPIFPATVSASDDVRLLEAENVYNPTEAGRLTQLFLGRVSILASPPDDSLGHIRALLRSQVCDGMKFLRDEVHKEILRTGTPRVDVPMSEQYLSRLEAIQRFVLWQRGNIRSVIDLDDLIVYEIDGLSCRYAIGELATDPEPQALVMSIDHKSNKVVIWRRSSDCDGDEEIDWDFEFAVALASEWKIDVSDAQMILSSPPARLQKYLALKNIPELDSQRSTLATRYQPSSTLVAARDTQAPSPSARSITKQPTDVVVYAASHSDRVVDQATGPQDDAVKSLQYSHETKWKSLVEDYEDRLCDVLEYHSLASLSDIARLQDQLKWLTVESYAQNSVSSVKHSPRTADGGTSIFIDTHASSALGRLFTVRTSTSGTLGYSGTARSPGSVTTVSGQASKEFVTGALGELFIFHLLSKELPQFTVDNWTSELRYYASGYKHEPYRGASQADFVYEDTTGKLTKMLFGEGSDAVDNWGNKYPRYHLEVKSTAGDKQTPFHFSRNQLRTFYQACAMTIRDYKSAPTDVYVLLRVWDLDPNAMDRIQFQSYPDPHKLLYTGRLCIAEDSVSVAILD